MKEAKTSCIPDLFLTICQEAKKNSGEDAFCHCYGTEAAMLGVFDGCGGLGAQRHAAYSEKTEAYMASRLCSGAFYDCFQELPNQHDAELVAAFVALSSDYSAHVLSAYRPPCEGDTPTIRGSMVRTLPSTAAVALIQADKENAYHITPIWAGDSRVYLLDAHGLAQLTQDDTTVPDPMENLYEDGILRNILCEGKRPKLRTKTWTVQAPFCIFAATDGCFGYFSTPMEFEGVLLQTLLQAECAAQWETLLSDRIRAVAGDDYTLCLAAYGIVSFSELQQIYTNRFRFLRETYLDSLALLPNADIETRREMWQHYCPQYLRFIKGDT